MFDTFTQKFPRDYTAAYTNSDIWGVYTDYLYCEVRSYIHTRCFFLFSEEIIEISAYSDMWGVYSDNLICWVSTYTY